MRTVDWEIVTGTHGQAGPPPLPPPPPPPPTWRHSRWGLRDAVWGWAASLLLGAVVGALIVALAGYADSGVDGWPLWLVAITQVPLWVGLLGAPLLAAHRNRSTLGREFGFRATWSDVPIGLAIGIGAQFLLVPLISLPWLALWDKSPEDLSQTAETLVTKATDPVGVVLLILIVAIGAPIIEELFYRGLLLRSLQKVVPDWVAIVLSGLAFGATHFQLLGLPALAAFGMVLAWLTVRSGRLGLAIFAHVSFNAVTVSAILLR